MASIRIDDLTTRRLSDFKGKKSYTVILNEMMDFFNNTGMRVTDNIASPIIVTQQYSFERYSGKSKFSGQRITAGKAYFTSTV